MPTSSGRYKRLSNTFRYVVHDTGDQEFVDRISFRISIDYVMYDAENCGQGDRPRPKQGNAIAVVALSVPLPRNVDTCCRENPTITLPSC